MLIFSICHDADYISWREFIQAMPKAFVKKIKRKDVCGHRIVKAISARGLISCTFPRIFSYAGIIKDGFLLEDAILTSSNIEDIIVNLYHLYAPGVCGEFIYLFQRCVDRINRILGISVSFADCVGPRLKDEMDHSTRATFEHIRNITRDPVFALTNVTSMIHKAADDAILQSGKNNGVLNIIDSGSKAKRTHFYQMYTRLGPQTISGKPPERNIPMGRILPHITNIFETTLEYGDISGSFGRGLSPCQLFVHAMAARDGIVASSTEVQKIGTQSRIFGKLAENGVVDHDGNIMRYGMQVGSYNDVPDIDYHRYEILNILKNPAHCANFVEHFRKSTKGDDEENIYYLYRVAGGMPGSLATKTDLHKAMIF
jgi:hypothetical protein